MSDNTIIIFDQCGEAPIKFLLAPGDLSYLHAIYINNLHCEQALQDALYATVYDAEGEIKLPQLDRPEAYDHIKCGAVLIVAGFLP